MAAHSKRAPPFPPTPGGASRGHARRGAEVVGVAPPLPPSSPSPPPGPTTPTSKLPSRSRWLGIATWLLNTPRRWQGVCPARRHDPSWIQQHGSRAFFQIHGQHCAGWQGAGQGAPLRRAGLQILLGNSVLLQDGEASKLKFYKYLVWPQSPAHAQFSGVVGPRRCTAGDHPQCLPEADVGRSPPPLRPSIPELLHH